MSLTFHDFPCGCRPCTPEQTVLTFMYAKRKSMSELKWSHALVYSFGEANLVRAIWRDQFGEANLVRPIWWGQFGEANLRLQAPYATVYILCCSMHATHTIVFISH